MAVLDDVLPGDFVRREGVVGVGLVESVSKGVATVAWAMDQRAIMAVEDLERVPLGGAWLDSRHAH